ncbi:MAG: hypothetical protein HDT14_13410 [Oscillibacter sp.]|nr:hypothetical protein [Oscillibacter sp.]
MVNALEKAQLALFQSTGQRPAGVLRTLFVDYEAFNRCRLCSILRRVAPQT